MSNNTDKVMELADAYASTKFIEGPDGNQDSVDLARENLVRRIDAMQKDCRTCRHCSGSICWVNAWPDKETSCVNHGRWIPVEFKQLTRSQP
jgi:hypothetical protein